MGDSISTVEAIQYCSTAGIASVHVGIASVHVGISSVLWKDRISTLKAVLYCGGIASVQWRLFSIVG